MKIKGSRLAGAVAGAVAAVAVTAFGAAAAAGLGGLNSAQVGSNDTVVAACDTDGVAIAYTTAYSPSASKYQVTSATVSGIAAPCIGQTLQVTIKGTGGTSLGGGSVVVGVGSTTETISSLTAAAEDAGGASVVIS